MNRKRIITSVGVILLVTGVVGGTWSGIQAMPTVINNAQEAQSKHSEKEVLYNGELEINKLNIDTCRSYIVIKKHDNQNVLVERSGNKEISTITAKNEDKQLVIKEDYNEVKIETKNVDDMIRRWVDDMYKPHQSIITVYLPNKVNADIKTERDGFTVEDDVFLDTLNFETISGYLSLSSDLTLENLNIKSKSDISLGIDEMVGIKNIKITANSVNIHGENSIEDETQIPENVEIKATSTYYNDESVRINAYSPVAKNLIINTDSGVALELPIVETKFNFDVKSSRGIKFESADYEKYNNTSVEKYFKDIYVEESNSIKEFKGLINEDLKDEPTEYNVTIKSSYTTFN